MIHIYTRGVDKFFKTLAKVASRSEYLLAKSENNCKTGQWERKNTRQAGEWVCIFTRQAEILLAFGEFAIGYPHPCYA
jgi:hypothetical protein